MNILWYLFYVLLLKQIDLVHNFNVDLHTYVRHSHSPGSMYGFSIAMHKTIDNGVPRSWLIIGAPKANLSDHYTRVGLIEPGVVFRCQVDADDRCQSIPFDQHGNKFNTNNEQIDTKSWQWFGATVASGGVDKPIVACAPRYVFHGMQPSKVERIEPVGTCFTAENFKIYREYSPCRTNFWGYHRQGYCQAGFSAAISREGDRLFIGAPGSWYWQGQAYSIHTKSEFPYKPGYYQPFGEAGQILSVDPTVNLSQVYSTREGSSLDDDSYLGYSMTVGRLNGSSSCVAVGMPRGEDLFGKVVIYTWDMVSVNNLVGRQIGEYFGYSVCAVDVDGDNLDDLIIGAPMHTEPNNDGKYDIGRIYIHFHKDNFESWTHIDGFKSRGRFGTAITALGDINKDGYKDFAVGAPYDGHLGNGGAVYIFHGSKTGPVKKPTQIIYADDLFQPYPRSFGFSLSGGMDLDENGYPDLAVGAYESDTVFFFKSRPVVNVNSEIKFLEYGTQNEINAIDIEKDRSCYKNGFKIPCARLRLCINYDPSTIPRNPNLNFDVKLKLDSKAKVRRMYSVADSHEIRKMIPLYEKCTIENVFIANSIQDKLTPMEVEVEYDIVDSSKLSQPLRRNTRDIPLPVVDQRSDSGRRAAINILKNCGPDNVCIPDLQLVINAADKYVLDDKKRLDMFITIANVKEDAFETKFYMTLPKGIEYASTQNLEGANVQVTCTSSMQDNVLICDIGNPFKADSIAKFKIGLHITGKDGYPPSYDFYTEVNSTNVENKYTLDDNRLEKRIKLEIKTDFNVHGNTPASFGYYKTENYIKYENAETENDLGPEVIHAYNFRNNGSAEIGKVLIGIAIPIETLGEKPLMYILNTPELQGNIKCKEVPRANPRNLKYDSELLGKSYLVQVGARSNQGEKKSQSGVSHTQSVHHGSTGSVHQKKIYTEADRRQQEQDERRDSPGDASETHSQRANQASSGSSGPFGSSSYSESHQWSTQYPPTYESEIRNQPSNSFNTASQGHGFRTNTLNLGDVGQSGGTVYHSSSGEYQPYGTLPTRNYSYSASWHRGGGGGGGVSNSGANAGYYRGKRQAASNFAREEVVFNEIKAAVNCSVTHCFLMKCEIPKLDSKEEAWVSIRSRLVTETLASISTSIPINISTMAAASIVHPPYRTDVPSKPVVKSYELVYTAIPEPEAKDDVIPLWVVVLSACAGVLILLLLAFLLYKCGFFNRNRPSDSSERQPLNGNRNYHGDEHL